MLLATLNRWDSRSGKVMHRDETARPGLLPLFMLHAPHPHMKGKSAPPPPSRNASLCSNLPMDVWLHVSTRTLKSSDPVNALFTTTSAGGAQNTAQVSPKHRNVHAAQPDGFEYSPQELHVLTESASSCLPVLARVASAARVWPCATQQMVSEVTRLTNDGEEEAEQDGGGQ